MMGKASLSCWSRARLPKALLLVLVVALAGGAIAWAAIPSAQGVISGCYDFEGIGKGKVRIIDVEAGESCTVNEKPLGWYSTAGAERTFYDRFPVQRETVGTGVDDNGGSCGPDEYCTLTSPICPEGKALSGGYRAVDDGTHVSDSRPAQFGYAWQVRFKNNSTIDTVAAIVTCDD